MMNECLKNIGVCDGMTKHEYESCMELFTLCYVSIYYCYYSLSVTLQWNE